MSTWLGFGPCMCGSVESILDNEIKYHMCLMDFIRSNSDGAEYVIPDFT